MQGMKVYVLGEVRDPGVYEVRETTTVIQAVAMAGGFTNDAKRESVLMASGDLQKPILHKLDMRAALSEGLFAENNLPVQRGDIIYVPTVTIANVELFFQRIFTLLRPVVEGERAIIFGAQTGNVIEFGRRQAPLIVAP
jgi:polysaccharide export outer membrane protein